MADDNAPCSDLVQERLVVRMARRRIAELEARLAETEEARNFWATDALRETSQKWEAEANADRWRRYAEHWRGRVRGASEAVRAAMGRERAAWAAWNVVVESLRKERERAGKADSEQDEWKASSEANAAEMMRYQIAANRLEGERERLVRLLCDLTPGGSEFVGHPDRCAQHIRQEIHEHLNSALKATMRAHDAEAERDRLTKIVSSMYAALGADLESGDDPAAEVARCVAERDRLAGRVAELEDVLRELLEVADLRGDSSLLHHPADERLCPARMQTAWDEARDALSDTSGGKGAE